MLTYRLRAALRDRNGELGTPAIDDVFEAADRKTAIEQARERTRVLDNEAVNAFWLTDAENNTIWSLRMADRA
ncbi:hypothetical protein HCU64_22810 [Methylobacterium sp. C25]|uniref:hypothetical protein n=1 Tax=Methylobacterium sp. C25 TaxID=2721622 RepID=UPI001F2277A9|nr:hypothetical protein [Methylobacterium sp. C25]MCE4226578.1 hypothetical protein [Methylobacterium sp. C25]